MEHRYYRPAEGDFGSTVAEGYQGNFEHLDQIKADAQSTVEALETKVDKVDGQSLMSDAEHSKLADIEEQANAYIHPESHPADMISDTPEKVVMTVEEREKLSGIEDGANAYSLPPASSTILGGVRVGANLTVGDDGILSADAAPYELPFATAEHLGGVKVGRNLSVDADGSLHAPSPAGIDPDELPASGPVSDSARLLGFSEAGATVAVTARQLRDYATDGLATSAAMNAALDDKAAVAHSHAVSDVPGVWHSGNFNPNGYFKTNRYRDVYGGIDAIPFVPGVDANNVSGVELCSTLTMQGVEGGDAVQLRVSDYYGSLRASLRGERTKVWRELWHSGNFDPALYPKQDVNGWRTETDCNNMLNPGTYDVNANEVVFTNCPLNMYGQIVVFRTSVAIAQLAFHYATGETFVRTKYNTSNFSDWHGLWHSGNLNPASVASVGLMSAEDKLRLNSVASALSLGVEPLSAEETDADVSPDVQTRARRSAQFQMQADEKLYDALEAFARNHPEYSEFAPWLAAKDQIRAEHPKPAQAQ